MANLLGWTGYCCKRHQLQVLRLEIQLILAHRRVNVHQDQVLSFKSILQGEQQVPSEDLAGPVPQNLYH